MYCYICTCFIYLFFIDVLIHFPLFSCSSNEDLFFFRTIFPPCVTQRNLVKKRIFCPFALNLMHAPSENLIRFPTN